jgi:hypothetical protein
MSAAKVDVILSWVLMLTNNGSQCLRKKSSSKCFNQTSLRGGKLARTWKLLAGPTISNGLTARPPVIEQAWDLHSSLLDRGFYHAGKYANADLVCISAVCLRPDGWRNLALRHRKSREGKGGQD